MFAAELSALMPQAGARLAPFLDPLRAVMQAAEITTPARSAMFLANVAAETGGLTELREDMNYSADALRRVWPTRFTAEEAQAYARQPERIASRVYASRMGNGDEASGDGWRYRGGGILMVTGLASFLIASREALGDASILVRNPERIVEPEIACRVGAWYWRSHNLNALADAGDFDGVCDVIAIGRKTPAIGDAEGFARRRGYFDRVIALRAGNTAAA